MSATFFPAATPPPGVQPHPENPESLAYLARITAGVCIPIITILFFARCYVRVWIKQSWIFEDWLCFAAWGGTVAFGAITVVTMDHHGGEHLWDISKAETMEVAYWFWIASIEYGVFICVTKVAVLWYYRRIFSTRRWSAFDVEILVLVGLLVAFYTAITLAKIFECTPHAKITNTSLPGTCINTGTLLNVSGLFNTITDVLILLMPAQALWGLKMDPRRKILVMLVFTFGLCAPIFSALGFASRLTSSREADSTWTQPAIQLWGAAELTTGNLCVCFPELGVFFRRKDRQRPTPSILGGARAAIANSKRKISAQNTLFADGTSKAPNTSQYMELDDRKPRGLGYRQEIFAPAQSGKRLDIPMNSIVVDYEIDVRSSSARSSV